MEAMSASEKRYFKRHYASEKNLTTDLFDYVNSQTGYNEEQVKLHFKDSKLSKNLKVYKVQLSDLLLKSLVSYYSKKSIKSKIRQGLEEIDILLQKQLYSVALSKCKKIKELAIVKEEKEYLIPILECEIKLNNFFSGKSELNIKQNVQMVLDCSHELIDLYQLKDLNYELSAQNNKERDASASIRTKEEAAQLLKTKLHISDPEKESLHIQFYKNSSRAILYKLIFSDAENELKCKEANIKLFENKSHLAENNASIYFAALYNYLVTCRSQNKIAELEQGLLKISKLVADTPSLGRNALYIYYLEIKHLYENNRFEEIKNRIEPDVIKHVSKYKQENEHLTVLTFIYFSINNLVLQDYHQVHFYLRRLFDKAKNLDNNYLRLFDIIELLSHLETQDHGVADVLIATLKRRTRTQNEQSSFYTFLLNGIREILRAPIDDRLALTKKFTEQWDNYSDDSFYQLAEVFILKDWKKAQNQGTTIAEIRSKVN